MKVFEKKTDKGPACCALKITETVYGRELK